MADDNSFGGFTNPAFVTPEQVQQQRQIVNALLGAAQAPDTSKHWTGVLAQALAGLGSQSMLNSANQMQQQNIGNIISGTGSALGQLSASKGTGTETSGGFKAPQFGNVPLTASGTPTSGGFKTFQNNLPGSVSSNNYGNMDFAKKYLYNNASTTFPQSGSSNNYGNMDFAKKYLYNN